MTRMLLTKYLLRLKRPLTTGKLLSFTHISVRKRKSYRQQSREQKQHSQFCANPVRTLKVIQQKKPYSTVSEEYTAVAVDLVQ